MDRLNKVIALSGICSRRKADELITEGRVKINGKVVTELGTLVPKGAEILVDNKVITKEEKKYYLLNKPRGVITSASDEFGRTTVLDIIPQSLKLERLYPVGRLDYDTKGVLILTNDGDFMQAIIGPKSGIEKEYLARLKGVINKTELNVLEKGVVINNKKTLPAIVKLESVDREHQSSLIRVIITQGMYHQVKEMFKAIGYEVKRLTRVRFGNLTLEGLKEGEIRPLKVHEIRNLLILAQNDKVLNTKKEKARHYSR